MEPFNIGLDREEIEISPDFDDLPVEPPKKKTRRQRKATTKKERECLVRKIQTLSVDELASFYLDKTRSKLSQHANTLVKEFSLSFESTQIYFLASSLQLTFTRRIWLSR